MRIKNVYISPEEMTTEDFIKFRRDDIKKYNLKPQDVFSDMTFENAVKTDIAKGLYEWDAVRIIHPTDGETFFIEINGILNSYHKFNE